MPINLWTFFSNTRNVGSFTEILDLGLATSRRESASERTKVIKTVHDSHHDLSSIGMQASSILHRVGFDIEAARRLSKANLKGCQTKSIAWNVSTLYDCVCSDIYFIDISTSDSNNSCW